MVTVTWGLKLKDTKKWNCQYILSADENRGITEQITNISLGKRTLNCS